MQESRLRQHGNTLLQCVCVCVYMPRGAGTMHQGGGVSIAAIREEGLAKRMRMCKCSPALFYPHVDVHATLCLQLQIQNVHMGTLCLSVQHLIVSE